ncbi:MAG: sodium:alanine symporter family protein [Planctomycetota bacterium]|nr:sodium:alanine symporter family protein [Planctomycetota bacterium]
MDALTRLLEAAAGWLWNWPVVALCLGAGVVFSVVTRFVQARGFAHALGLLAGRHDRPDDPGHLTHLQALSAAVAGTVGLGNIAGVAVAVTVGGPGALFWMWVVGLLGMATKFAEVTLGTHYRVRDERGVYRGGAIYTITRGLPERWPALAPLARPLALVFAGACAVATLGAGNMFQARSVAELLRDHHGVPPLLTGVVLAAGAGAVILGGIGRIGRVAATLVPFMCGAYVLVALGICVANAGAVPAALGTILRDAFTGEAAAGGAVWAVIVTGVRRAVFSSEAGLGTAPMAHATARTAEPVRQGLVALLEPLLDTVVVCSATGLVIVLSGQRPLDGGARGRDAHGARVRRVRARLRPLGARVGRGVVRLLDARHLVVLRRDRLRAPAGRAGDPALPRRVHRGRRPRRHARPGADPGLRRPDLRRDGDPEPRRRAPAHGQGARAHGRLLRAPPGSGIDACRRGAGSLADREHRSSCLEGRGIRVLGRCCLTALTGRSDEQETVTEVTEDAPRAPRASS